MTTINYDQPIQDFIDQLSATDHVTHTKYIKTSVTFHHNAGRLSLQGILDVWKVRPASAHFQVDRKGALGQYVHVNEYAWATGTRTGNAKSISIEMANETLSPDWVVNEVTWKAGARLAGWLFVHVIKQAPTASNVHLHSHWKATLCAGPHIRKVYDDLLAEVQASYKYFLDKKNGGKDPVSTGVQRAFLKEDGLNGPNSRKALQLFLRAHGLYKSTIDGEWGPRTRRALQAYLRVTQDGSIGPKTRAAFQAKVGHRITGVWRWDQSRYPDSTTKAWQAFYNNELRKRGKPF